MEDNKFQVGQWRDSSPVMANLSDGGPHPQPPSRPDPFCPDAGLPWSVPGYVVGRCWHRVAQTEWNAGLRTCERCPDPRAAKGMKPAQVDEIEAELNEVKAVVDHGEAQYNPAALTAVRLAEELLAELRRRIDGPVRQYLVVVEDDNWDLDPDPFWEPEDAIAAARRWAEDQNQGHIEETRGPGNQRLFSATYNAHGACVSVVETVLYPAAPGRCIRCGGWDGTHTMRGCRGTSVTA